MDMSEAYLLLSILKESLGHPKYQNIRQEAEKRLQEINDGISKPVAEPKPAAVPKAFPASAPDETTNRRI